jgi:low affinity Fe/Cu permease
MPQKKQQSIGRVLERAATAVSRWTGSTTAFVLACAVILVWALMGPVFGFSNTWQLVINSCTTIVTFLMVFLIQRAQNKDALAIQLKLNELVAALEGASNRLIDVEDLSEDELEALHRFYARLSRAARKDATLTKSHTVEEADLRHERQLKATRSRG